MRTLSAGATAAQAVRSPKYDVSVTLSARGQNASIPAIAWTILRAPTGSPPTNPAAGMGWANGSVTRFVSAASDLKYQNVSNPTSAWEWNNSAFTTLRAVTASAVAAHRHDAAAGRVYWIDSGNVRRQVTTNSGAGWFGYTTEYAGGDAAKDLVINYHLALTRWCFGFSTLNSGTYAAYFNFGSGNVKYADDWRAAGIYVKEGDSSYIYCLVSRAPDIGPGRLRVLRFDGTTFDQATDIDNTQAGLFGIDLVGYKFCPIYGTFNLMGPAVERAYGGNNYEGIGGVFLSDGELVADEPIIFPKADTANDKVYSHIAYNETDYYYFNQTLVYRGVVQTASSSTFYPISYVYDDHRIDLVFKQTDADFKVGEVMTVRRIVSFGASSGYEDLAFYIVRVARNREQVFVHAVDPVGLLGIVRCRRPSVISDGAAVGLAQVLRRLCARYGLALDVDDSNLESAEVMPMTLQPSESLLGAAFRAASQSNAWLVPSNDGTFKATLINPGASDSGDYDDDAQPYPANQWTLIDALEICDYRRLAFSYVLGTYSTNPDDGAAVAMAEGPSLPNTRPLPYSVTNTRYNTADRVDNAAAAEAARQKKLTIDAIIEAPANLSLELYDMVSVTEPALAWSAKSFRVRRIREVFEQGLLTQAIYLGAE